MLPACLPPLPPPDYICNLGDVTAHSETAEWEGYRKWKEQIPGVIYEVLGNHDRDNIPDVGSYGTEFFTQLGNASDTRALQLGNMIFILVSEEHNPEHAGNEVMSTIPRKRLRFIRDLLEQYASSHNVFVLSHTPITGTVALSDTWFMQPNKHWRQVSTAFLDILHGFPVAAHISGHIHSDYRKQAPVTGVGPASRRGKFVRGEDIGVHNGMHFLNMPCIDIAHGWFPARASCIRRWSQRMMSTRASGNCVELAARLEGLRIPLFDLIRASPFGKLLGRSALYYAVPEEESKELAIITRWIEGNQDVETWKVPLHHPIEQGDGVMRTIAADVSIRAKENCRIGAGDWFFVPAGTEGRVTLSTEFPTKQHVRDVQIASRHLASYTTRWKGSTDGGGTWSPQWRHDPQELGAVNAVLCEMKLRPETENNAVIEDVRFI